ncbi:MAG: hypothetical protein V4730_10315 [Pseudomonadota bacterium]
MAERFFQERAQQRGQVLWGLLVMLGLLTELALGSLQLAAHEGISVNLLEQRLQQDQRLQVIAQQMSRLPIPARSAAAELWQPLGEPMHQGCGQGGRASYVAISQNCSEPSQPLLTPQRQSGEWQWRLRRIADDPAFAGEGSDVAAFPTLQAQSWQLEVVVAGRAGTAARGLWQRYQQVAP